MDDDDWLSLIRAEGEWADSIRTLGFFGKHDEGLSPALRAKIRVPMETFVDRLRSGDPMPPSAMKLLAELIDPKFGIFSYRLDL
jgi:hypothetical protein